MLDDSNAYARRLNAARSWCEKRDTLDPIGDVADAAHFRWDALPKGTRLEATAGFDNSPNNKFNPDTSKEVRWDARAGRK